MKNEVMVRIYKALADETRIKIIELLSQGQNCGCDLIENLTIKQPTLSHHLKVLAQVGIIKGTKAQNKMLYTVDTLVLEQAHQALIDSTKTTLHCEGE